MADSKGNLSIFELIEQVCKNSLHVVKDIYCLFLLEVKLAGKSLVIIICLSTLALILLVSSWFSLLGVLIVWLLSYKISLILTLLIVSAFNLFIAILLGFCVAKMSSRLRFEETRKQLALSEADDHETVTP